MDTFKTIMKEQIIEILDIDNVIDACFKKMDEKHKEELDEDGTYADWFPSNQMKKDILKLLNQSITKKLTKPKGSNLKTIKRNAKICTEYDKYLKKGRKQKEALNLLSKKYGLQPIYIKDLLKKIW